MNEKKKCPKCEKELPVPLFYKDSKRKDGLQLWCKDCGLKSKKKRYYEGRKEQVSLHARKYLLKRNYGLELEDYEQMLKDQKGVCLICKKEETQRSNPNGKIDSLRVDHCHTTGDIRGLLCSKCNFGISQFDDKPELLLRAFGYLQGWLENHDGKR